MRLARDHYDLVLGHEDLSRLAREIRENRHPMLRRRSNNLCEFLVEIEGRPVKLLYSGSRRAIVSVLSADHTPEEKLSCEIFENGPRLSPE